jgi:hypothetical protein
MLKGTLLISPYDKKPYFAFYVKSQISDNRPHNAYESIADERLLLVQTEEHKLFSCTSPAKFIDLHAPRSFVKTVQPPGPVEDQAVIEWIFNNLTIAQYDETKARVEEDTNKRITYLQEAFSSIIMDLTAEINELQGKMILGDHKVHEKILKKQEKINDLQRKKAQRLAKIAMGLELNMKPPEILGCFWGVLSD